jgi:hypothetical protein
VNKPLAAVVLAAAVLLSGCSGPPKMSVEESCKFLSSDTFAPSGNEQQQADQIAKHYQEVADKVAPEVAGPIQKMADIMKNVAGTSLGSKSAEQTQQLKEQNNKIGEVCK